LRKAYFRIPLLSSAVELRRIDLSADISITVGFLQIPSHNRRSAHEVWSVGQPKINQVKIVVPLLKFMKRPQTKFHADTMSDFKIITSKKDKFIVRSKVFCSRVLFSLPIFY